MCVCVFNMYVQEVSTLLLNFENYKIIESEFVVTPETRLALCTVDRRIEFQ